MLPSLGSGRKPQVIRYRERCSYASLNAAAPDPITKLLRTENKGQLRDSALFRIPVLASPF
jgi:hypothetical protein